MAKNKTQEYHTIGEVAKLLSVDQHVIRFWTSKFATYVNPVRKAGLRRYYNNKDIEILSSIKNLLYDRGFSIKGVLLLLSEKKDLKNVIHDADVVGHVNIDKQDLDKIINKINTLQTKIKKIK